MSGLARSPPKRQFLRSRDGNTRLNRDKVIMAGIVMIGCGVIMNLFGATHENPIAPKYGDILSSESIETKVSNRDIIDNVLIIDEAALENVRATYKSASSWTEWDPSTMGDVKLADKLDKFQTVPLGATVDRRPMTAKRQMALDEDNLHNKGSLLGCAMSAGTFVSNLSEMYREFEDLPATCDVCIQFSNRHDKENFLPGIGYETLDKEQTSMATKCFSGKARVVNKFQKWQSGDERFVGFGYPFNVECILPNGIKELTCEGITNLEEDPENLDSIQKVYFKTSFALDGYFSADYAKAFRVVTQWPWDALKSHDDDRSHFATSLPESWNDESSTLVPTSHKDLNLAHVVGPSYRKDELDGNLALESMKENPNSNAGVHFRMIPNLFHLIRNAPGSTHILVVVDGQFHRTTKMLSNLLDRKFSSLYPRYANGMLKDLDKLSKREHIPITIMNDESIKIEPSSDIKMKDVLFLRGIKIRVVPLTTPSIAFERSVCGGQYALTSYLAARFAPDYHVMMYIDGDTAMIEKKEKTMQETYYDRFFSEKGTRCAGHRYPLLEQYVKPKDDNDDSVLTCVKELAQDAEKWNYAVENCHLKEGHIVARTDSIVYFNVHHPDTTEEYLPKGVKDCITPGNANKQPYFLKPDEIVQIHLRDRERKPECACFMPVPKK